MPPNPCQHCGNNFMPVIPLSEGLRLCNNCILKNDLRTPKGKKMDDGKINILIKFPKEYHAKIEENCISQGVDFSQFFLDLYELYISEDWTVKENIFPKTTEEKKGKKK